MDEERRRILRMMAEGTISGEECDELLRALTDRRKEKTQKDVQAAQQGSRPIWPYILLVALAIVALSVAFAAFSFILPLSAGPIEILLTILWIWMIVDCLSRIPYDFRLLFTTQHKYEKWIWLAIVILAFPVGAIVYFFIIRKPTQQIAPPSSEQKPPSAPRAAAVPERPLRPTRRARSIKPLVGIILVLAIAAPVITSLAPGIAFMFIGHHWIQPDIAILFFAIIPGMIILLAGTIFWICMLISCLARDYREFGTLITSDKSADKLIWVLLILFLPIIGAIAYHIPIRRQPIAG